MAVVAFWNGSERENGQTLSIIAIANQMAIEHNYRILVVDGSFNDKTMERAFWKNKESKTIKALNAGKIDVSSGAEGLVSAVASNKATPEIVTNYTRIVYKNRLDILLGLVTKDKGDYAKAIAYYEDIIITANKYYDLVLVDLHKGDKYPSSRAILNKADLVLYTLPPNMLNIDHYIELLETDELIGSKKVMTLLSNIDERSSYNMRNITRYLKERGIIPCIPYNVRYMEATNEAKASLFFTNRKLSMSKKGDKFFDEVERACVAIINKLKALRS